MTFEYEVGETLNNSIEVSNNAIRVEIMDTWHDTEDDTYYAIVKCREVIRVRKNEKGVFVDNFPWMTQDEINLVSQFTLDKYYSSEG